MKRICVVLFAALTLAFSSLACQVSGAGTAVETNLEDLRMAHDEFGMQETSMFSSSDVFYAVAKLKDAPQGTVVKAIWTAVDVTDTDAGYEFQEQSFDVTEELFSGTIFFKLSNDDLWPSGRYRLELFLNEEPAQSLEFEVE